MQRETRAETADAADVDVDASLDHSVALLHDTRAVGAESLRALDAQSAQLGRVQARVDAIDDEMSASQRLIRGMESVWGSVGNRFRRDPVPGDAAAGRARRGHREEHALPPERAARHPPASALTPEHPWDRQVRLDAHEARDKRTAAQLAEMSAVLGDLKAQAAAMGTELDHQHVLIDDLTDSVDRVNGKMTRNLSRMRRL